MIFAATQQRTELKMINTALFRSRLCAAFAAAMAIFFSAMALAESDYSDSPLANQLIDELVTEQGFERQQLVNWLSKAKRQERIISAMSRPAEKVKPWYDYRKHFISERRISAGIDFWHQHRATLDRAQQVYGVDPAIIVGIIGIETNYGRNTGSYRVIDALTTLAFDYYTTIAPRESRQRFFTGELKNLFLLAREQGQDPLELTGSYAGAMGWGQFMPSSYRAYAVDFDGDQFADIWNNPTDAIGSVASYFASHGWELGEPVAVQATFNSGDQIELNRLHKPRQTVASLSQSGFAPLAGSGDKRQLERKALPLSFELEDGEQYWLGYNNFYVISRYNPRTKYAMAVYQLSDLIAAGYHQKHPDL
jgi:membrane-bound lytic murein transglycosylase B